MSPALIHPTAIVDPRAEVHETVRIGPYCIIDGPVRLGADCELKGHVVIAGPSKIGSRNIFYPFACIGERSQDTKYAGEPTSLVIGHDNVFRENVTVHRSTTDDGVTAIGNHGLFLAYTHIAHDCVVGDYTIFSNNGTLAGHVTVEDHVVIGGLTAVHQFCRLGQHSITGGCSKIVQDVPPFMIADGNPAEIRGVNKVGLERRGFSQETIRQLREAYRLLYRSNLNTQQSLEKLRSEKTSNELIHRLVSFIETSERGIVR